MSAAARQARFCFANCVLVSGLLLVAASAQVTVTPGTLAFANTYIGLDSHTKSMTVKNTGKTSTTITAITSSCPEFQLASGTTPAILTTNTSTTFSIFFAPDAAKTFDCTYTLTQQTGNPLEVTVGGTGLASAAVVSTSPTLLSFPNQAQGTPSATQVITISNSGTGAVTVTGITITPPTFAVNPVTLPIHIDAGAYATIGISYSPALVISETGAVAFTFDQIPNQVVDLSGNGTVSSSLVLTNIATLPAATQNAAYQAQLIAASGTPPYTFSVKPGSTMPAGLTISSTGLISGPLASTATAGNYTFTAGVKDSDKHNTTKLFNITVAKTTGAACNNISFDVPKTTTPIVPITDLATGTYQGEEGGLYPNGSNVRPASHDADGVTFAKSIVPLDGNGVYSPTGKEVMIGLGESTALDEFTEFLTLARTDPAINPAVVFVTGAQGGATPSLLTLTASPYWNTILNNFLPDQGLTANQVVAMWIEDSNGIAKGSFPSDMTQLQAAYETVMNNAHTFFPNLKLVYFSSRIYAGYSNGVATINPEPYAYEAGFAVKNAIADQLNGNANLNYNPTLGPVEAPWMSWGPYYWADGLLASEDGMVWTCQDLQADGTHPSLPAGDLKVAGQVLNFFKTDDTTTPWFLKP